MKCYILDSSSNLVVNSSLLIYLIQSLLGFSYQSKRKKDNYSLGNKKIKQLPPNLKKNHILNFITCLMGMKYDIFYTVVTAVDGQEGLEKVQKEMQDIVVSDIMMPRMSGMELCKGIKENIDTCHIPVVLLTAKTVIDSKLEALKTGADDYITKPFNVQILLSRCNNLVNSRIMMQEKFSNQPQSTHRILANNEMDKEFIDKAMEIVQKHMGDPDFSMEMFAREVGIARTKLFIKLKAISGQTLAEFILTIRLKEATVMLKNNPGLNIMEMSDRLGFSSPKYFRKCFKDKYHVTPQEYRKGI